MQSLGIMDQLFYKADQYHVANMVMGGASILQPVKAGQKLRAEKIVDHIAARLEKIPLMRQKFVQDPLRLGTVRKIEDPDFDVGEHFQVQALPTPGGYRELTEAIGEISSRPLSLTELWRWTLLEGLEGGRLCMVCQMHHALFDGLGAMQALSSMYDPKPVPLEQPAGLDDAAPREPGRLSLLGSAVAESTDRLFVKTPHFLRHNALPMLGSLASGAVEMIRSDYPEVQDTSLNISGLCGKRAVAYKTLSLSEIKTLARHFHCTVNDIALLLYSFALEHYFKGIGEKIDFDLWCGMPISTRSESSSAGNQVSNARINLHNTVADTAQRLQSIHLDVAESKKHARPESPTVEAGVIGELVPPQLLDVMMFLAGRTNMMSQAGRFPMFNALISNVPGPRETMYIGNARLVESIPLIPLMDMVSLSAGVTSLGDALTFSFHCDRESLQNPGLLAEGVTQGLAALSKAAGKGRKSTRARKAQPRKKKAAREKRK